MFTLHYTSWVENYPVHLIMTCKLLEYLAKTYVNALEMTQGAHICSGTEQYLFR